MIRYAVEAPSGVVVISDVRPYNEHGGLRAALACWLYYTRKYVWS